MHSPTPAPYIGLTEEQARRRLTAEGPNELPTAGTRSVWRIALEILREPMFALLLAGGAVYVALGDLLGGAVLLGFASLSVTISIVQELRSERVLEALRAMTSPRALVIRDGAGGALPAVTWCAAISWSSPKGTACRPTPCCSRPASCWSTNCC